MTRSAVAVSTVESWGESPCFLIEGFRLLQGLALRRDVAEQRRTYAS
jgi:hypothetical protein